MDRDEVRARLCAACPPDIGKKPAEEAAVLRRGRPASVLVGLLAGSDGPRVILTERNAQLKAHPAEISLPGGGMEPGDDGPAATALRETYEEIGLPPEKVELLGCLPVYETVSGYCVYPIVGWIEPPVEYALQTNEVADVFEVPLSFVLDPGNRSQENVIYEGQNHCYYVLPYPGHRIWGATAGILVSLARALGS